MRLIRAITSCLHLSLLLIGFWFSGTAIAQEIAPNELILRGSFFWQEKIKVEYLTGPDRSMMGWHPSSYGISLSWFHWSNAQSGYGIETSLDAVPFSYQWEVNYALFPGGSFVQEEREIKEKHLSLGFGVYYGSRLLVRKKFSLNASAGLGVIYLLPDEGTYTGGVAFVGTPSYTLIERYDRFNAGRKVIGYGGVGIDLRYRVSNFNLISFGVFAQFTPSKDTIQSDYTLYPGTSQESTGRMKGGLGQAGIQIGYVRTWGYPKLSKRAARKSPGSDH
ncbi:MAG TPA: hypothetical protein PLB89_12845 [Flavobacteriales bacterium]|nr:hypothetical protein [Flavobacteriales bacterium]